MWLRTLRLLRMVERAVPSLKKAALQKSIGTHSGSFHCDEVLACHMLRVLPEYRDARIVRSRDPKLLQDCDIVVDVGGEYDPSKHRYDHHQRGYDGTMHSLTSGKKPWVTKLSSAGLVYLHFGRRVLAAITGLPEEDRVTEELYDCVYTGFVEEIDAVDNGINDRDGVPRYKITSTISSRVGRLNPAWNDPDQDAENRFERAMALVGSEFNHCVLRCRDVWLPARNIVKEAIERRTEVHPSGEIIRLEHYCPWKEHIFQLEEVLAVTPSIKFVLYQSEGENEKWRIQAVSIHPSSFQNRYGQELVHQPHTGKVEPFPLSLPEPWRGVRDNALSELSGIPGCVFVHASGFIGGNDTYDGALQMATKALQGLS